MARVAEAAIAFFFYYVYEHVLKKVESLKYCIIYLDFRKEVSSINHESILRRLFSGESIKFFIQYVFLSIQSYGGIEKEEA